MNENLEPISESDVTEWLGAQVSEHTPGDRRTDDIWPEELWALADKVAEQHEVLPEDAQAAVSLYHRWQDELNAEDALSE